MLSVLRADSAERALHSAENLQCIVHSVLHIRCTTFSVGCIRCTILSMGCIRRALILSVGCTILSVGCIRCTILSVGYRLLGLHKTLLVEANGDSSHEIRCCSPHSRITLLVVSVWAAV